MSQPSRPPVSAVPSSQRRRSRTVRLLLTGATSAAAVLLLTQCQRSDPPRYQYASLPDCVADWEQSSYCEYENGYYYAPNEAYHRSSSSSSSHTSSSSKTKKISGTLVSSSRGGFGRTGSLFSGSGS